MDRNLTLEKIKDLPASHNPTSSTARLFDDRRRKTKNTSHKTQNILKQCLWKALLNITDF